MKFINKNIKLLPVLYLLCVPGYIFPQNDSISMNHYSGNGFKNPYTTYKERSIRDIFKWLIWDKINGNKPSRPSQYDFKFAHPDVAFLTRNRQQFTVTWIGHSTVLIQLNGVNILTDPIWSERASPVSFLGPKRVTPPGLSFEELPDIDIKHNHYDHLDFNTIRRFGGNVFYVIPLGTENILMLSVLGVILSWIGGMNSNLTAFVFAVHRPNTNRDDYIITKIKRYGAVGWYYQSKNAFITPAIRAIFPDLKK